MNYVGWVVLFLICRLSVFSQVGEYVIEIDQTTGAWIKTGPPITGVNWIYPYERAYNENAGQFIFPSAITNHNLYTIDVANDSVIYCPQIASQLSDFQYDNGLNKLFGLLPEGQDVVIVSIDPKTALYQQIGSPLPFGGISQGNCAFDQRNHSYFVITNATELYSFDATNSNVKSHSSLSGNFIDIAFDNTRGILFGLLQIADHTYLASIDPVTGSYIQIGSGTKNTDGSFITSAINENDDEYIFLHMDNDQRCTITTFDIHSGNVIFDRALVPTVVNSQTDNCYSLEYDNIRHKLYAYHWEGIAPTPPPLVLTNVTIDT